MRLFFRRILVGCGAILCVSWLSLSAAPRLSTSSPSSSPSPSASPEGRLDRRPVLADDQCELELWLSERVVRGDARFSFKSASAIPSTHQQPLAPADGDYSVKLYRGSILSGSYGLRSSLSVTFEKFSEKGISGTLHKSAESATVMRVPFDRALTALEVTANGKTSRFRLNVKSLVCRNDCYAAGTFLPSGKGRCCAPAQAVVFKGKAVCSECGNNRCDSYENKFNCEADCR